MLRLGAVVRATTPNLQIGFGRVLGRMWLGLWLGLVQIDIEKTREEIFWAKIVAIIRMLQ